ncbi:MAG TPA: SIS domain-containing protein, partial [Cryptosporangiaceae bacterium]|nr:SIS domain-containing protein [Cryptosporangiaceae bacterium]
MTVSRLDRPVCDHVDALVEALGALRADSARLARWGRQLADRLSGGHRLLAAGNGGSAAEAQHLTAELVGRYRDDRPPFSAIALHADTSSLTAIANDYGYA